MEQSRYGMCGKKLLFATLLYLCLSSLYDIICRTASPQRNYAHFSPVNDLALHSNQGELISCDQNGAIKIWDLGADCCSHELVRTVLPAYRKYRLGGDIPS